MGTIMRRIGHIPGLVGKVHVVSTVKKPINSYTVSRKQFFNIVRAVGRIDLFLRGYYVPTTCEHCTKYNNRP